jgi:hypothetical protein
MNIYNPFMDDMKHNITGRMQDLSPIATLQQANAEKLEKAKELLGVKYILHPVHSVKRKENL